MIYINNKTNPQTKRNHEWTSIKLNAVEESRLLHSVLPMIRTGLNDDNSSWKTELIQRARRQPAAMTRLSGVGVFWALLSLLAAVGASFGFYMPYWLQGQLNGIPVYFGVFRRCNYPRRTFNDEFEMVEQCGRYSSFMDIPSLWWQVATIAVGTGCGLAVLIALIAILAICIRGIISPFIARIAGVLQMCSGRYECVASFHW